MNIDNEINTRREVYRKNPNTNKLTNSKAKRIGIVAISAIVTATAALGVAFEGIKWVGHELKEVYNPEYKYSDDVSFYQLGDGEGIWYVADQVNGIEKADPRIVIRDIEKMPENADVNFDNPQIGESIAYYSSVEVAD